MTVRWNAASALGMRHLTVPKRRVIISPTIETLPCLFRRTWNGISRGYETATSWLTMPCLSWPKPQSDRARCRSGVFSANSSLTAWTLMTFRI